MDDHSRFLELAALAAGGHLSSEELKELDGHIEVCVACKNVAAELRKLVRQPLPKSRLRQCIDIIVTCPDPGARERFIRRASHEGITFSPDVKKMASSRRPALRFAATGAGMVAALVIAFLFGAHHLGAVSDRLNPAFTQQNRVLEATTSQGKQSVAVQQFETDGLHTQVATPTVSADNARHDNERTRAETTQSAFHEESEAQRKMQEKVLADTRADVVRLNRARASDQASLVADEIHINELAEQLKTAKANTSNMQRQLVTASGDVRNLMGARQLHVVDVRDTDPNGKAGKAFGRIFLAEDKALVFYAFDLNDLTKNGAKKTFQVWGQQGDKTGSLRSLGFLNVDSEAQHRWALKADDSAGIKEIDAVFVTVEPQGGAESPSGKRLLFAYLGNANHP